MKRFHIVPLVWGVGLMLFHSINLIEVWASAKADSMRLENTGVGFRQPPEVKNLKSETLPSTHVGPAALQQMLEQNFAQPLALASGDFDEDGVPDLVTGYASPHGGILTLHRGNLYSIYPNYQGSGVRDQGSGTTDQRPATVLAGDTRFRSAGSARVPGRRRFRC
ncbi:MAG: hypothetical protein HY314_02640 [Acidobacteria bacterium]|nr:hypothetical protein [Acidobacteriota bacterium]